MRRKNAKLLEMFFLFCQKIKDEKTGWQTVGDALRAKSSYVPNISLWLDAYV
jgi:hypothetical protein